MYFQWRASRGGAEAFQPALVPHAGPDSRVFRDAVHLGQTLARLPAVEDAGIGASVAILWDAESWWALQGSGLPVDYLAEVRAVHAALWRAGIATDFAWSSAHRVVVVPALFLVSVDLAARLRDFVAGGGTLVVTYLSAIADADLRVHLGGYPGVLRDVLGIRVTAWHPGPDGWSEDVSLLGASVFQLDAGGAPDGKPAVTRHSFGAGTAWYVSTRLDSLQELLVSVCASAGVGPTVPGVPAGVEAVRRGPYLFLLNHTASAQRVPATGVDLVTGTRLSGSAVLPPGGYLVVGARQSTKPLPPDLPHQ
jgi:beta-galactosidase